MGGRPPVAHTRLDDALLAADALIVDREGFVLEGSTSNLFLVKGKKLVTPPHSAGILLGITRVHVIELARAENYAIEERAMPVSELFSADELFITSSIREVVPVVSVDGRTIAQGRPGPVAAALLERF